MSTISYCTLNGQPIPKDYGYTEEERAWLATLAEENRYRKYIVEMHEMYGNEFCKDCLWSDFFKDLYGVRPHFCPCKESN